MKINRRFTQPNQDVFSSVEWETRTSRISNPDGSVVFEMTDAQIPKQWSQLATDIMVSKYFRKAGVPQEDGTKGPEKSAKQVIHRLAGCWREWGEKHNYFDSAADAQAFYDELSYMLLHQMCAPNSPQWFNTGLNFAYDITGPAQGHFYCDPTSGELKESADAYSHPQPHACFIQSVADDLVNRGGIMDLWTREARLFKYGSGTGSNFSKLRGDNEKLSGGGKSSGLMSFLKIGDRAAGAIKSGGTTRRAAKMVCLDLDHPDVEQFVNWKVREELKVACLAEGIKHIAADQQELAKKLGLKLDYDFNGEAYYTVSGQNSNNSVRIPDAFFKAVEEDGDWNLVGRTNGKVTKTMKARDLWEQIAFAAWRCADPGVQYDDTINGWHTCPKSGRINASNPCVTGDTRVLLPGGIWRRIDQMIHLPARVMTNLNRQEIHAVDGAFPTGTKEVFELKTVSGYSVKCTADHKIYTRRRGWVEAQQLTHDDEICLPAKPAVHGEIGEPTDDKFFHLLGVLLSTANNDGEALHLETIGRASTDMESLGGYIAENWAEKEYDDDYTTALMVEAKLAAWNYDPARDDHGTAVASTTNRRLLSRLKGFVRNTAGVQHLNDDAFTIGLAAQKHLLRALFTADGVIRQGSIELMSDSAQLLRDVQTLLLGFGVKSILNITPPSPLVLKGRGTEGEGCFSSRHRDVETSIATEEPLSPNPSPLRTGAREEHNLPSEGGAIAHGGAHGRLGETRELASAGSAAVRHGLRIDPGSLRLFAKHIGLLAGRKQQYLSEVVSLAIAPANNRWAEEPNYDHVASFVSLGSEQVFDLTEPMTHSFVANGITVHNCSEYMFLDDTACNLASLNVLTFFDSESRRFDIEAFKHGVRIWTIVLEISVLMASFPSEEIARLSYKFRTLGLGYANLGAMLMQAGIAYDSEKGRAICAALTAILTGESYATSAEMAREMGPFAGYAENKTDMLRVIRNHRRAAWGVSREQGTHGPSSMGVYEGLDINPVPIEHGHFSMNDPLASTALLRSAQECWDRALFLGERHGYRNAQTTVIAPTGTIGLLMDCDTTGVEPDFALVKFKKLAGGGYFKIANQSLAPSLRNLGYSAEHVYDILKYVMGSLSLHDSPEINVESLKARGFSEAEINKIEASLPGMFELGFAFSAWSLSPETFKRLDIPESEWQAPGFNLLKRIGFTGKQIDKANDVICGHGTVEGAPHLKEQHYSVFDCANKCGKTGERFIAAEGHIRMMAAAQPFISGAISKTINLPNEATIEQIKDCYELSWKLGLKANALYRDGSKLSQPLNVKSDKEVDAIVEEDDEENVKAAHEEVADDVALAAATADFSLGIRHSALGTPLSNLEPVEMKVIERIVERIVERPLRRRLPDTRHAITHKFDVAGHEGYITCGLYEDGSPGEMFITMAKEGSTIGGLMDTIATLVSVSLQYGVPVESLVRKFEHVRFEPNGMTRNAEIPMAKSVVDYIFRWMAMEFVSGYREMHAPQRAKKPAASRSTEPQAISRTSEELPSGSPEAASRSSATKTEPTAGRMAALAADPLSQQGSDMQSDAPACDVCGSITVRSGTCYKCLNCGNSMGCS